MSLINYLNVGKNGEPNSKSRCSVLCDNHDCSIVFIRRHKTRLKHHNDPGIAGDYCKGCIQKLPAKRKRMSAAISEMIKRDPGWKERMSIATKGKINIGEKNGMKKREARDKASKSRKKMFEDPAARKKVSIYTAKAWADGKYDGVKVGRCKWFSYEKKDGTVAKCQGTWELAYAKWLDENNIRFIAHRGRIGYVQNGLDRSYYPDFYLVDENIYVDIKNKYHFSLNEEKFSLVKAQNPNIVIKLLFKKDLKKLGIKI